MAAPPELRALELYCGIGGCATALDARAEVVAALDINRQALAVYQHNLPHRTIACTLESIAADRLGRWQADLWWMSPPCQPFTRRGRQRDLADARTQSLLRLIEKLEQAPPRYLALENVPGFRGSLTYDRLRKALEGLGYRLEETLLCPTELGIPNRRQRFYLVAGERLLPQRPMVVYRQPLCAYLDPEPCPALWIDPEIGHSYRQAMDVVEAENPGAVAACFTSAYGHSPVRSGSYLRTPSGPRRFSPQEILRLLGFPSSFSLPADLSLLNCWRLVGNSLSIPAVRQVLSSVPELAALTPLDESAHA